MAGQDLPGPGGDQQSQFSSQVTNTGVPVSARPSFTTTSHTQPAPNQSQASSYMPVVDNTRVVQGSSTNLSSTCQSNVRLPSFAKIQSSLSSKSNTAMSSYTAPAQPMQTTIMKVQQQALGQTVASSGNRMKTFSSNQMPPNTISFQSLPPTNAAAQSQSSSGSSQVDQHVAYATNDSIQTDSAATAQLNTSSETLTADENSKDDISEIQDVAKILASLSNPVSK